MTDADPFDEFVRVSGHGLLAAVRLLGNPADAEDVTQACSRPSSASSTLAERHRRLAQDGDDQRVPQS
jgi:hypothetical protein